jgi:hypothetical protein
MNRAICIGVACLLSACAAPQTVLPSLPRGWSPVAQHRGAAHHESGGTIAANVHCDDYKDVPLDVLTNHLLFGIENKHERSRTALVLDGRAALRTRLEGTLDGVTVALDVVVMKKDGCTYDLALIAPPAVAELREGDFDRAIVSFSREHAP